MILRNFLNTLRSHKAVTILNITGLAVAFTAFYVMSAQVWYSVSFNRPIPDSDRVYMVSADWNAGEEGGPRWSENCPQPATREALAAFPDGELYTWFNSSPWPGYVWKTNESGEFIRHDIGAYKMGTSGVEIFGFREADGDLMKISEPDNIIISRSAAEKTGCQVGDAIWFNGGPYLNDIESKQAMTVVGIFEDFPVNTFLYNHHIFFDDGCVFGEENNAWNYSAFVKLKDGADLDEFARIWQKQYADWYMGMVDQWKQLYGEDDYEEGDEVQPVKLTALDDMYFESFLTGTYYKNGSVKGTATIAAIALLVIIIAFINFFNFYMVLVPFRIRNVNINKVLGASQRRLRSILVGEALLLTLVAFCLSILLILAVGNSFLKGYVTCSLAMEDNMGILVVICLLMLVTAAASALFPAIYTTDANTSVAVKAGFAQSKSGQLFRSVLVGIQFSVSMALIIVTAVFFLQYRYMIRYDVGFDRENVLSFTCYEIASKSETLIERIKQRPDVAGVTASATDLLFSYNIWGREKDDKHIEIHAYGVRYDFPEVMGISVIEWPGFSGNPDSGKQIMFTESTMPAIQEMYPGETFDDFTITGTIRDIRLGSVVRKDSPICLYTDPSYLMNTFYIRTMPGADIKQLISNIKELVTELEPRAAEPEILFMNERMNVFYGETLRQTTIIAIFALIAVMISLMGVFSIVMFETRHRQVEISIRKVYGATVEEIIRMLNRRYIIIVSVCFLIAAPVAYFITGRWLEQFAHRISVPLWVFPASLALVLAVTISLVTLRSLRSARTNPAETLKKE